MTIYIRALMKVVGIQAKDGTIEVAIGKKEAKRATEVIGKGILEDKMDMVGRHKLRLKMSRGNSQP